MKNRYFFIDNFIKSILKFSKPSNCPNEAIIRKIISKIASLLHLTLIGAETSCRQADLIVCKDNENYSLCSFEILILRDLLVKYIDKNYINQEFLVMSLVYEINSSLFKIDEIDRTILFEDQIRLFIENRELRDDVFCSPLAEKTENTSDVPEDELLDIMVSKRLLSIVEVDLRDAKTSDFYKYKEKWLQIVRKYLNPGVREIAKVLIYDNNFKTL